MSNASTKDDIIAQISKLPPEMQGRVLDYAKSLVSRGREGRSLLRFEGIISPDDLQLMSKAIED